MMEGKGRKMGEAARIQDPATAPGRFRPRRLTHVNLFVSDYERSMGFYRTVAGFNEAYRQPLAMAGFLSNGSTHHDIAVTDVRSKYAGDCLVGLYHIALELETEVDLVAGFERALEAGMAFEDYQDHDMAHSVYGRDPDGNLVEIYADVVKDWRAVRSGVVTKPKPPWKPGLTPPSAERNYCEAPVFGRVETAVFRPLKTTHVTFVASRYEAMVRHYSELCGLSLLAGGVDHEFAVLGGTLGEASLALFRAGAGRKPGLHHIGIKLASEAELARGLTEAARRGIAVEREVDHAMRRSAFVRDPDGYLLQFYVDRSFGPACLAEISPDAAIGVV